MAPGKSLARGVFRHDDVLIFQTGAEHGSTTSNEAHCPIRIKLQLSSEVSEFGCDSTCPRTKAQSPSDWDHHFA
jgi:hypothetical protein